MILELLLFTVALSVDSFSAALALGFRHFSRRRALFFALTSGLSEGIATAIGFLLGRVARDLIVDYDHWIAFFLLGAVGAHMVYEAYRESRDGSAGEEAVRVHGPWKILMVSAITSIDSLGVGVSLGLVNKPIVLYSLVIGAGAFIATYLGLYLARRVSTRMGGLAELAAGMVLILLGMKMLTI
jgi:putative Mn2+ efflux pump MntP